MSAIYSSHSSSVEDLKGFSQVLWFVLELNQYFVPPSVVNSCHSEFELELEEGAGGKGFFGGGGNA